MKGETCFWGQYQNKKSSNIVQAKGNVHLSWEKILSS